MGINLNVQPSVGFDNNWLILATPRASLPEDLTATKVSDLSADTAVDVTYALTTDGFNEGASQDTVSDDRLSLPTVLAQPGKVTESLTVRYVFGSENDVADPLFVKDEVITFAVRRAVPHSQALAAGDKFDYITVKCGVKQNDQYAANANFTRTQVMFPAELSQREIPLKAA